MSSYLKFNMGTAEYLIVDITDTLGEVTSIPAATFDIYDADYVGKVVDGSHNVLIDGLRIKCLIEPEETWGGRNDYDLYVNISGLPASEAPRLGPIRFSVEGYA